jgi:hypothetical protein
VLDSIHLLNFEMTQRYGQYKYKNINRVVIDYTNTHIVEQLFVSLQIWKPADGAVQQPQLHIRNPGQSDARLRQQRASRLRRWVNRTRHLYTAKLLSE